MANKVVLLVVFFACYLVCNLPITISGIVIATIHQWPGPGVILNTTDDDVISYHCSLEINTWIYATSIASMVLPLFALPFLLFVDKDWGVWGLIAVSVFASLYNIGVAISGLVLRFNDDIGVPCSRATDPDGQPVYIMFIVLLVLSLLNLFDSGNRVKNSLEK